MNHLTVTPLVGFDNVKFGMSRDEVRQLLGDPICEFRKSRFSKTTTDDFGAYHVFYDAENRFEAVEFFADVTIQDDCGRIFPECVSGLVALPYSFSEEYGSYICKEYSIGIYAPNQKVESILFASENYYA